MPMHTAEGDTKVPGRNVSTCGWLRQAPLFVQTREVFLVVRALQAHGCGSRASNADTDCGPCVTGLTDVRAVLPGLDCAKCRKLSANHGRHKFAEDEKHSTTQCIV